jgi:hypothetical protein
MFYVGLDDTDTLQDPGTNQLARHLVRELAGSFSGRMIIRHQLSADDWCGVPAPLIDRLREIIMPWCPAGSDPGLCVATAVPAPIIAWGLRCQRELVTQVEARQLAADHGVFLQGLSGTEDGVIGALSAVGLMATKNDGRVV